MPEPVAYRRKPAEATALQWIGPESADAMSAFLGADFMYDPEGEGEDVAALCSSKHSNWVSLYAGDWAVRGEDGSLRKLDADDFGEQFEAVDA